jgi:addiction module HigA family antidote
MTHERWQAFLVVEKPAVHQRLPCRRCRKSPRAARLAPSHLKMVRRVRSNLPGITADAALRLAKALGTSAQLWLNLQNDYDVQIAKRDLGKILAQKSTLAMPICWSSAKLSSMCQLSVMRPFSALTRSVAMKAMAWPLPWTMPKLPVK